MASAIISKAEHTRRGGRAQAAIAIVAVALALYVVLGHAFQPVSTGGEHAMHGAAIRLVIAALIAPALLVRRVRMIPRPPIALAVFPVAEPRPAPPPAGARASPQWLQRFLN